MTRPPAAPADAAPAALAVLVEFDDPAAVDPHIAVRVHVHGCPVGPERRDTVRDAAALAAVELTRFAAALDRDARAHAH